MTEEEIISAILKSPVRVLRVVPQDTITSLQGRGVRLDALADVRSAVGVEAELLEDCPIGEKGAHVNIEVQKLWKAFHNFCYEKLIVMSSHPMFFKNRGFFYI